MAKLFNLAVMTVSGTPGTGTITLGVAVAPYLTFALAGVGSGDVVWYSITDGTANSEVGIGTYTSAGTTLTRGPYKSTNANAAISATASAIVRISALASDGGDILPSVVTPMRGFDTPINLQLNATVATNILTITVVGNNASAPSNTNPILIPFRDASINTGDPTWRSITGALSITTNAVGASLGTANTVPFRLWVVAFDNSGTVVLALWQSVTGGASPTAIAPLNESNVASTTPFSAAATSAGTFYTPNGTTITSKSFRILGYVDYAAGLTTAGTYASAPTTIQLFGPGIKKPCELVQTVCMNTNTQTNVTSATFTSTSVTASISPTSTPNIVKFAAAGSLRNAGTNHAIIQMFRGSTALNSAADIAGVGIVVPASLHYLDAPGTTSSTAYTVKLSSSDGVTQVNFPFTATAPNFGTLVLDEVMV